jgi:hypothetical protein
VAIASIVWALAVCALLAGVVALGTLGDGCKDIIAVFVGPPAFLAAAALFRIGWVVRGKSRHAPLRGLSEALVAAGFVAALWGGYSAHSWVPWAMQQHARWVEYKSEHPQWEKEDASSHSAGSLRRFELREEDPEDPIEKQRADEGLQRATWAVVELGFGCVALGTGVFLRRRFAGRDDDAEPTLPAPV